MPYIAVATVNIFLALLHCDIVFLRVGDGVFARIDIPLSPRRDDLHVGRDRFIGQFEAHLVVALAGAAMRKPVRSQSQRNFRLAFGDHWTRHRGAQQIRVLVNRSGTQRGPDVVANKLFAQIFHQCRGRSRVQSFLTRRFQILLLADIADHRDDFAIVVFLEPGNDDGRVEPAGISEYDLFRFEFLFVHDSSFKMMVIIIAADGARCTPISRAFRIRRNLWL